MLVQVTEVAAEEVDLTLRLAVSIEGLRAVLREIAADPMFEPLWPTAEAGPRTRAVHHERARTVEMHISAIRYRASRHCRDGVLDAFERDLLELDVAIRGALSQPYTARCAVDVLLMSVERFGYRWQPYLDPLPGPLPRLRCDETDRSIWLDGRCIAPNLPKPHFEFVRGVAKAAPNAIKFSTLKNLLSCLRGTNQSRLRKQLPPKLQELIEGGPKGYTLKLPPRMSASVVAA